MNIPKTRAEARATNAPRYNTGEPCKWGHYSDRYTSGCCVDCMTITNNTYNKTPEQVERNRARNRANYRAHAANPEFLKDRAARQATYREDPIYREKKAEYQKAYRADPEKRKKIHAANDRYRIKTQYNGDAQAFYDSQARFREARAMNKLLEEQDNVKRQQTKTDK